MLKPAFSPGAGAEPSQLPTLRGRGHARQVIVPLPACCGVRWLTVAVIVDPILVAVCSGGTLARLLHRVDPQVGLDVRVLQIHARVDLPTHTMLQILAGGLLCRFAMPYGLHMRTDKSRSGYAPLCCLPAAGFRSFWQPCMAEGNAKVAAFPAVAPYRAQQSRAKHSKAAALWQTLPSALQIRPCQGCSVQARQACMPNLCKR